VINFSHIIDLILLTISVYLERMLLTMQQCNNVVTESESLYSADRQTVKDTASHAETAALRGRL